jgi:phosphoglycolate phosphatase-like HAD superfamily hydrolase
MGNNPAMTHSSSVLVLFDIDGTLIQTGRAGVRGMNAAFQRLYGVADALDGTAIAGRTDRGIVIEVLRRIGRDATEEEIAALRDAYLADLPVELARPAAAPKRVLPGVEALLDALSTRSNVAIGLLTGNFHRGARIKLEYFRLWHWFPFGAFGDDHPERRPLVALAVERSGVAVAPDRTIIIGDTPLDVDCAHAYGACAIGVTTGPYDAEALRGAGAQLVVSSLESPDVIRLLTTRCIRNDDR